MLQWILRKRHVAAGRHPTQRLCKQQHQQRTDDEYRHGQARAPTAPSCRSGRAAPRADSCEQSRRACRAALPKARRPRSAPACAAVAGQFHRRPNCRPAATGRDRRCSRWRKLPTYCVRTGRSRPSCSRSSATVAGSGATPPCDSSSSAGSPGTRSDRQEDDARDNPDQNDGDAKRRISQGMVQFQWHAATIAEHTRGWLALSLSSWRGDRCLARSTRNSSPPAWCRNRRSARRAGCAKP